MKQSRPVRPVSERNFKHAERQVSMTWRISAARPSRFAEPTIGITIAASAMTIATTTVSSISMKPRSVPFLFLPWRTSGGSGVTARSDEGMIDAPPGPGVGPLFPVLARW